MTFQPNIKQARKTTSSLPLNDEYTFMGVSLSEFNKNELRRMLIYSYDEIRKETQLHDDSVDILSACRRIK